MSAMKFVVPVALVTLLSVAAPPVMAQQQPRGRDDPRRGDSGQRAVPRDSGRQAPEGRRGDVRRESIPQSRGLEARGGPSYNDTRRSNARAYDRRGDVGRNYGAAGRPVMAPRHYSPGWGHAPARPYRSYGPSYRSWYRSDYYYSRPYYAFRPRFSIGIGLWLGYPVSLPRYGYAPYPVYGYPSGGYVNVTPGRAQYGAVSFEIYPAEANLYVDGTPIGRVGDFNPNNPPLTLTPGPHRIEVVADGYEPLTFDANVAPGQVIPYRGEMRPY